MLLLLVFWTRSSYGDDARVTVMMMAAMTARGSRSGSSSVGLHEAGGPARRRNSGLQSVYRVSPEVISFQRRFPLKAFERAVMRSAGWTPEAVYRYPHDAASSERP